jgi:hypothetical protein
MDVNAASTNLKVTTPQCIHIDIKLCSLELGSQDHIAGSWCDLPHEITSLHGYPVVQVKQMSLAKPRVEPEMQKKRNKRKAWQATLSTPTRL